MSNDIFRLDFQGAGDMPMSLVSRTEKTQGERSEKILSITRDATKVSQIAKFILKVHPDAGDIEGNLKSELSLLASINVACVEAVDIPIPVDPKKYKENNHIILG